VTRPARRSRAAAVVVLILGVALPILPALPEGGAPAAGAGPPAYRLMLPIAAGGAGQPSTASPTRAPTATATGTAAPAGGVPPLPVISRNAPAFASSAQYPAADADDASYDTQWRSSGPAWLAYDLSAVPAARRGKVVVAWYNNDTGAYDHTLIGELAYNLASAYTLEANAAPGGTTSPPASGWVALASVADSHYHSRQHALDLTSYNWLRMNVTAVDGSAGNADVALNLDVHDASAGAQDDWIFFGDSITAGAMNHDTLNGVGTFAQLVSARAPGNFPVDEGGGVGYLTSADGAKYLPTWLALFPGRYVGLAYGTNDANGNVSPATFYANYAAMVQAVLAAGKVPVVPHIPWGCTANIQADGPLLNQQIDLLYQAYPQVVRGPDLWAYFQANQGLISSDCIHPSIPAGMGAYRQQWATAMLSNVYNGSNPAAATATGAPTRTAKLTAGAGLTIYDNAVAPSFADRSFYFSSRNPCDTSVYVSPPCAYSVAYQGWGGLNFISLKALAPGPTGRWTGTSGRGIIISSSAARWAPTSPRSGQPITIINDK
jgi:hypothetical protein